MDSQAGDESDDTSEDAVRLPETEGFLEPGGLVEAAPRSELFQGNGDSHILGSWAYCGPNVAENLSELCLNKLTSSRQDPPARTSRHPPHARILRSTPSQHKRHLSPQACQSTWLVIANSQSPRSIGGVGLYKRIKVRLPVIPPTTRPPLTWSIGKHTRGVSKAKAQSTLRRSARLNPQHNEHTQNQRSLPANKTLRQQVCQLCSAPPQRSTQAELL